MASDPNHQKIVEQISSLSPELQRAVFRHLRKSIPIHPLEKEWNLQAEVILEAISRSPDLSQRGIRGLIAEAFFEVEILPQLDGWSDTTPPGLHPYDFRLERKDASVRIQVKTQRKKSGRPMSANEGYRRFSKDKFVVETQKTRAGRDQEGRDTRPYRFGEFDILAVCMEPSSGEWADFRFTVERWLLEHTDHPKQILKFQPISKSPDSDWTDNLAECIDWFLSGTEKKINE